MPKRKDLEGDYIQASMVEIISTVMCWRCHTCKASGVIRGTRHDPLCEHMASAFRYALDGNKGKGNAKA